MRMASFITCMMRVSQVVDEFNKSSKKIHEGNISSWISFYSEISSLTSTVLIFLAARYAKRKKLAHTARAGKRKVSGVISASIRVSPTILIITRLFRNKLTLKAS